jgi:hypothetical protein
MDRVLAEINGQPRVETEDMSFGTLRHESWQEEAQKTGKVADCFGLNWQVSHIEHEFTTEIMDNVICHSRPDIVAIQKNAVLDYKTVVDNKQGWRKIVDSYRKEAKQRQLKFYAFQLGLHGIRIREGIFLCEIWNAERDTILGYEVVRFPITLFDIAGVLPWVRQRVALLASAVEVGLEPTR